jgi:hypothetical protein
MYMFYKKCTSNILLLELLSLEVYSNFGEPPNLNSHTIFVINKKLICNFILIIERNPFMQHLSRISHAQLPCI